MDEQNQHQTTENVSKSPSYEKHPIWPIALKKTGKISLIGTCLYIIVILGGISKDMAVELWSNMHEEKVEEKKWQEKENNPLRVVVVMPQAEHSADSVAGREIIGYATRYWETRAKNLLKYNIKIEFQDDRGDMEIGKKIAYELTKDPSVLMVIGPFASSMAVEVMPIYLQNGTQAINDKYLGPVPMLLPVPTRTDILSVASKLGSHSILRLPPDNAQQAKNAIMFTEELLLKNCEARSVNTFSYALLRDQDNPSYSNDLGRCFETALANPENNKHRIVLDIAVGGSLGGLMVTDSFKDYNVDVAILCGMTKSSLQVIRQAKMIGWNPKYFLLTDGALSEELLQSDYDFENINSFLMFQLNSKNEALVNLKSQPGFTDLNVGKLGFGVYGYDSAALAHKIITEAIQKLPDGKRITRPILRKYIEEELNKAKVTKVAFPFAGIAGNYSFDANGQNTELHYHTYKLPDLSMIK